MKVLGFSLFSNNSMKTITIRAEEFNSEYVSIGKHEKIVADIENLLVYWIGDKSIKIEDIDFKEWPWPNYVRITLENKNELRIYLQYINTKRIMARELYTIIEDYMK